MNAFKTHDELDLDLGIELKLLNLLGVDLDFGLLISACFWVVSVVDPDLDCDLLILLAFGLFLL